MKPVANPTELRMARVLFQFSAYAVMGFPFLRPTRSHREEG